MGAVRHLGMQRYIKQVFVPAEDPCLLSIFEEERTRAGLLETDIDLQVPEEPGYHEDTPWRVKPEETLGNREWGYSVILFPASAENDGSSLRRLIRHGLAHIKYGDCDRQLPGLLGWLYNKLVEEPRANWYAAMG